MSLAVVRSEGAVRRRVGERKREGGWIVSGVRDGGGGNGRWRSGDLGGIGEEADGGDCRKKNLKVLLVKKYVMGFPERRVLVGAVRPVQRARGP